MVVAIDESTQSFHSITCHMKTSETIITLLSMLLAIFQVMIPLHFFFQMLQNITYEGNCTVFLQTGCPSCHQTNSDKALKVTQNTDPKWAGGGSGNSKHRPKMSRGKSPTGLILSRFTAKCPMEKHHSLCTGILAIINDFYTTKLVKCVQYAKLTDWD